MVAIKCYYIQGVCLALFLFFTIIKMTKKTTTTTTELSVELANFNFKIENFEDEKMFILSYDWINKGD